MPTRRAGPTLDTTSADDDARMLKVDVITDRAGFEGLETDWNDLFARCARGKLVFQSFNWNWHWLNHFATPDGEPGLAVLTVRKAGRLVALWPLVRIKRQGLVMLEWMGAPVSQYGDILIDPDADIDQIMDLVWPAIQREIGADLLRLTNVRDDALITTALKARGGRSVKRAEALYLDLAGAADLEHYETRYSAKARKNRRRLARRLMDLGDVAVEVLDHGPRAGVAAREAIDLKARVLDSKETAGHALQDPRFAAFFADAAEARTHSCGCRVTTVRLAGELIGATIDVNAFGHRAVHILGFDARYTSAAPGIFLIGKEMETAYADGIATVDFLAPKYAYKEEFADGGMDVHDYCVPVSLPGHILCAYWVGGRALLSRARRLRGTLAARLRRARSTSGDGAAGDK